MINATIIADSKNEFGNRLTTFVLTMPRIILAEFNTHRMISRNSASSRAIPFDKMLKMVESDPFIPIKWMKDHKGMQGDEYLTEFNAGLALEIWLKARDRSIETAKQLNYGNKSEHETNGGLNVTKQIVNRLLEPFMWHTVIATATEWDNLFALRAHNAAEIHMQDLAYKMLEAYNQSTPKLLTAGEWHIPFGDNFDDGELFKNLVSFIEDGKLTINEAKLKIATARCARVSYTTVGEEGKKYNYENDIKLHDNLANAGHWSPFEHCALQTVRVE